MPDDIDDREDNDVRKDDLRGEEQRSPYSTEGTWPARVFVRWQGGSRDDRPPWAVAAHCRVLSLSRLAYACVQCGWRRGLFYTGAPQLASEPLSLVLNGGDREEVDRRLMILAGFGDHLVEMQAATLASQPHPCERILPPLPAFSCIVIVILSPISMTS